MLTFFSRCDKLVCDELPKTVGAIWRKDLSAYRGKISLNNFNNILSGLRALRVFLYLECAVISKIRRRIMAKVELKKPIVEEIKANLEGAATAVVVDYRGLTVEQDTQLRKNLREAGVVYKVYKNTMVNFAIEGTEFEGLKGCLEGPTGLAICKEDATAAARVLADFAKNAPALELKGGVVEGTFYDAEGIQVIAKIPSRETLISKFLGSIQSPIANFARVIKQIAEQKEA